jgi:hypothetical protein
MKPATESKIAGGFASRGAAVLSSRRLLPVEASGRIFKYAICQVGSSGSGDLSSGNLFSGGLFPAILFR